ncbi:MAG TPA: NAD(P)-dependent oxidoreductase [Chloroflexota bacterium]|nr:NAD(P)-dependent oxidoreductase [Chloroflexota bacterium]
MGTVLVTGAAGYIAGYILPALRERFTLRLVDNRDRDGAGRPVEGLQVRDLSGLERMEQNRDLFRGAEAVVHLAFERPAQPRRADPHAWYLAERANIDMAYAVYRLALQEGVRRVVVASSNHAADFYEGALRRGELDRISADQPRPLSDNFYGWAKEAYEHLGFVFAAGLQSDLSSAAAGGTGGSPRLEVVQIRIGAPRDLAATSFADGRESDPQTLQRDLGAWVSPRDLAQLFRRSIEAPSIENELGVPFQVFYGISGNTRRPWSIANAQRVIGYAPQDDSEVVYAEEIRRFLTGPAGASMVSGAERGGQGHR